MMLGFLWISCPRMFETSPKIYVFTTLHIFTHFQTPKNHPMLTAALCAVVLQRLLHLSKLFMLFQFNDFGAWFSFSRWWGIRGCSDRTHNWYQLIILIILICSFFPVKLCKIGWYVGSFSWGFLGGGSVQAHGYAAHRQFVTGTLHFYTHKLNTKISMCIMWMLLDAFGWSMWYQWINGVLCRLRLWPDMSCRSCTSDLLAFEAPIFWRLFTQLPRARALALWMWPETQLGVGIVERMRFDLRDLKWVVSWEIAFHFSVTFINLAWESHNPQRIEVDPSFKEPGATTYWESNREKYWEYL